MPRRHPKDPGASDAIGRRVAEGRQAAGLTQRELAELLGIKERSVQAWEQGETSPYRRLSELTRLLNRSEHWILYGPHPLDELWGDPARGAESSPRRGPQERHLGTSPLVVSDGLDDRMR